MKSSFDYYTSLLKEGREAEVISSLAQAGTVMSIDDGRHLLILAAKHGATTLFHYLLVANQDVSDNDFESLAILCLNASDPMDAIEQVFTHHPEVLGDVAYKVLNALAASKHENAPDNLARFLNDYRLFVKESGEAVYRAIINGCSENAKLLLGSDLTFFWGGDKLHKAWISVMAQRQNKALLKSFVQVVNQV